MLAVIFKSKGSRRFLTSLTLIAFLICAASIAIPFARETSEMRQTGGTAVERFEAMAFAVEILEKDSLAAGAGSAELNELLSKTVQNYGLHRGYVITQKDEKLIYIADSGEQGQNVPAVVGESYPEALYPQKCVQLAKQLLDDNSNPAYYPHPVGEGLAVCYFPLTKGCVLGIEAKLQNTDFVNYSGINFNKAALYSGIVFVILFLLCLLVRSSRKMAKLKEEMAEQARVKQQQQAALEQMGMQKAEQDEIAKQYEQQNTAEQGANAIQQKTEETQP
ncbi:MAG: hypothetical protein IKV41_06980 [Oscillospiraceae bacterium]|nr:hypothetical protein [Oscillospiraceae bacterium]